MEARRQRDPAFSEVPAPPSVAASGPARPCIVLDRVSLRFQSERRQVQALSDISLSIAEGEFVALLGPTGCGKSSLLRLVSDLRASPTGTMLERSRPVAWARRRNQSPAVFQYPAIFSLETTIC